MAVYTFTRAIAEGRQIQVANAGNVWRDFTYVDDIVEGVVRLVDPRRDARSGVERGSARSGHQQPRPTGSTISATTARKRSTT